MASIIASVIEYLPMSISNHIIAYLQNNIVLIVTAIIGINFALMSGGVFAALFKTVIYIASFYVPQFGKCVEMMYYGAKIKNQLKLLLNL